MKANQAFKAEEEAVSPVVGVILMVAITVVLAAVVFVLVNNLGKGGENKPNIGYAQNQSSKTLTISSADQADWNDIEASITGTVGALSGCEVVGGMAGASTVDVSAAALVSTIDGTTVNANDVLTVSGGAAGETCTLQLRHVPTNQSYGSWPFNF